MLLFYYLVSSFLSLLCARQEEVLIVDWVVGAMTDVQNKIPENAFGEINVMQEEEGEGERK